MLGAIHRHLSLTNPSKMCVLRALIRNRIEKLWQMRFAPQQTYYVNQQYFLFCVHF